MRLSVSVLVEEDGKRERGASGGGGRFGYEFFLADLDGEVRADAWRKKRCVWRWSIFQLLRHQQGQCR